MGKNFYAGLMLALFFLLSQTALAISDSLVSKDFETDIAKKTVESIAQYKNLRQLLSSLQIGNRNDVFFLNDLIEQYGDQPLPKISLSGTLISLNYGTDKTQIELVSSLERAYVINEIKVQLTPSESLQDLVERMARVYKSRKQRIVQQYFWSRLFLNSAVAAEQTFFDKHPEFTLNAIVWGVVTVGIENKISQQAKLGLAKYSPAASSLNESLHSDLGVNANVEISCIPRYINVSDSDRSASYTQQLSKCCKDSSGQCEHLINSISNAEHPVAKSYRAPAAITFSKRNASQR